MRQIKKLYNIMSIALKKIKIHVKEHDFEKLRHIEQGYENNIIEGLKKKFPDMFDRKTRNVSEVSERRLESSDLIKDLEIYLGKFSNDKEEFKEELKEELIFLVKCLDLFLEGTFYGCIPVDQDCYSFYALNDNFGECQICLLPRMMCGWEHKNRDAYTSYSIFYYLRNFYYICEEDVGDYKIQHILMPKDMFREAVQRGEFRVMVSPVSGEKVVEMTAPYLRDNSWFIAIKPIRPNVEERLKGISVDILKKAASEKADILVFPEMLGTDGIVDCLREELDIRCNMPDNEFPRLTMSPTIWKQHKNCCKVLDDMGDLLYEQHKHHGVDLKLGRKVKFAKEDIHSNRKVFILHCHGIGRIAVVICKDFLMTKYIGMLAEKLRVSLFIVTSFTGQDYQFKQKLSKFEDQDCDAVWTNTCSARWLNEEGKMEMSVTMAYLSGKKGIGRVEKKIDDFCKSHYKCDKACTYTHRIVLDTEVER